jgi:hypothetical protein
LPHQPFVPHASQGFVPGPSLNTAIPPNKNRIALRTHDRGLADGRWTLRREAPRPSLEALGDAFDATHGGLGQRVGATAAPTRWRSQSPQSASARFAHTAETCCPCFGHMVNPAIADCVRYPDIVLAALAHGGLTVDLHAGELQLEPSTSTGRVEVRAARSYRGGAPTVSGRSCVDNQFESVMSGAAGAMSAMNTSFLAAARRQMLSRRWRVRRSAPGKIPGCSAWRRSSNSVAVRSGSASSHPRIRGHTSTKGSFRVRQSRRAFGSERCVGRTSPSCHAVARLFRKRSSSPSR